MKTSAKVNAYLVRTSLTALLICLVTEARQEVITSLSMRQSVDLLLAPLPLLTIIAAMFLFLVGLVASIVKIWAPAYASNLSVHARHPSWFKWISLTTLLLFIVWFLLFSPWQVVFTGFWTRYLFLLAVAGLIAITSGREGSSFGWRQALLALICLLYVGMVQEVRQMTPQALIYRSLTVGGAIVVAIAAVLLYHAQIFDRLRERLIVNRVGFLRLLLIALFALTPVVLLYVEGRVNYAANPFTRYSLLMLVWPLLAMLLSGNEEKRLTTPAGWFTAASLLIFGTILSNQLTRVTNYPFSLTWSEGNRFYDYSLVFASHLYPYAGKLESPYFAPGRYALWGSLFIFPNLPIWIHRLWNVILQTLPALAVGWLIARPLRKLPLYTPFALWIAFYLLQGPIQPPLLVSLLLFLPFLLVNNIWLRAASLAVTSLAAGLSRWTWAIGPGVWGALIDLLLYYPHRKGNVIQRLLPTALTVIAGILPGTFFSWIVVSKSPASIAFKQPLLWYRLWPNATYPLGILPGLLLASGPLLILLTWLVASRRWKMDWIQIVAAFGATLAFLGAGIVISMKIGGGADLHNLDLFLVTTALLAGLAAYHLQQKNELEPASWPRWSQIVLALCLLVPAWNGLQVNEPPFIPNKPAMIQSSLESLRKAIALYQPKGEILFMDQRQLLTFGYVKVKAFVPDYEKKYLMDQAMAGNRPYFEEFYRDLANHRFALIVSDPLRSAIKKEQEFEFGEENNAWVNWVALPVLCYYEPLETFEDVRLQLLIPRAQEMDCSSILP